MIIFGTRGVTYSKTNGDTHCPACQGVAPYKHKRNRQFFTLYFIPLIPLNLNGEYVECQNCKNAYNLEVLDFDPEAEGREFEAEFHRAIKQVMIDMLIADGVVNDEEVTTVQEVYSDLAGTNLPTDQLLAEISQAQSSPTDILQSLSAMAGGLNDPGKEMVIRIPARRTRLTRCHRRSPRYECRSPQRGHHFAY